MSLIKRGKSIPTDVSILLAKPGGTWREKTIIARQRQRLQQNGSKANKTGHRPTPDTPTIWCLPQCVVISFVEGVVCSPSTSAKLIVDLLHCLSKCGNVVVINTLLCYINQ